ncbi:MAG: hypothetical protein HY908_33100, partial [Myxococcales bacterium]|nr:hypothetical protein [Myxococcales bacterium]
MRHPARLALLPLFASSLLFACAGDAKLDPPITSASGTPATRASGAPSSGAAPAAPSGPVRVALVAREPVVLSEAGGDTWIVGSKSGKVAVGKKGELAAGEALAGLPLDTASIARVEGRLPGSVWVSLVVPDPDKKHDRAPLYRHFKSGWREIAPDWNPEIVPWSKNRMLAGSTSSGKLKLKIVEPQTDKPPADMPSRRIGDDACQKSFKLRDLAALPDGTLFGVGRCAVEKRASYVVVRWLASPAPETAPAPKASGSRRPKRGPRAAASASASASA